VSGLDFADATYTGGSAHVEFSGDQDASADFDVATGYTGSGLTFLTYADATGAQQMTVSIGQTGLESGMAVTIDGVTTGGDFDTQCSIEITENSGSEVAGQITCENLDAVTQTGILKVSVTATFSATP
jgi:hypothetical protein